MHNKLANGGTIHTNPPSNFIRAGVSRERVSEEETGRRSLR